MTNLEYLTQVLAKYAARDLNNYVIQIALLKKNLRDWAGDCLIGILDSGSRAKRTAISMASDVDYLVSLNSTCNENNGGLKGIYDSLHQVLKQKYGVVRQQNVSFRIDLNGLEVDITPARKHSGNTNDHWLYVSKKTTWRQTNIQKHITDISGSNRTNEIKLLKIWRELNKVDFPSIYMEYLILNSLSGKSTSLANLENNFYFLLTELSKDVGNPLNGRIDDPANSTNILSDLLTDAEKKLIIAKGKASIATADWKKMVW